MNKRIIVLFSFAVIFCYNNYAQTLVATYSFAPTTTYNGFWGITQINDTLWIGSDYEGKLYKVTKTGAIRDSLVTPFAFNHGLAWDGTGFWIAEDFRTSGARIYKINISGQRVDSILTGSYAGGIGGITLDGNNLWFAVYSPDFASYPYAYAYKVNLTTRQLVDTIPLRGRQVQGMAVKGDTIFYSSDNFQGDPERIYAYRKSAGDTIFSFPVPDPDGDCDPRGLYWDGQHLWLMAYRIGNNIGQFRNLYKYSISGQGSPQITTGTNSVNFGNVIIGQTSNLNFTITNSGSAKLIISNYTLTNPRFGISPNTVPDTLQTGQTKNYTLSFTPTIFDTTSGELRIASNDVGTPVKVVNLRGKGVFSGSYIGMSVSNANFNTRRTGSLSGFTFDITNQGSAPLVINSVSFGSQRFSFDNTNVTFPVTIDTQRTRTFRIWFSPNSTGVFNDSAVFSTNAVNNSSAKILLTGTGQVSNTSIGDIMWESVIPDNPNTSSDDFQPKSLKQISDVNGDGKTDIICATENYWTICYNGNSSVTADTLWKFNTHFGTNNTGSVDYEDAMQIMNDLDGDGVQEVVIGCGGGNEMLYVLSGKTGRKIWAYGDSINNTDGDIYAVRIDKDYNNDGRSDVLISASGEGMGNGRHSVICLNAVNGQVLFNIVQPSEFTYDVSNLTSGYAIGFGSNGGPYGVRGFNNAGNLQWSYTTTSTVWSMREIPDINGDNNSDLIGLWGFAGGIFALSGANGSVLWNLGLGSSNNGTVELLDDKDRNGFPDVTFSAPQVAYRIDSKTNATLWQRSLSASYIRDAGLLGDITGDTIGEVLYSTQQPGKVFVLNGNDGTILFEYTFGTTINERADRVAVLNSVDGNQSNEFVGVCRDGRIKCFSGGPLGVIGINPGNNSVPKSFALYQNYPNPFNPVTQIRFDIPQMAYVKLKIFDILGREILLLVDGEMNAGTYKIELNADKFASGIYFYEITAGDFRDVKKMVLVK